jgi:hypothetical protein
VSLVGNWTEKCKKEPLCAGERSQHVCDRAPGERALGERSPRPANVRTRASHYPTGALDILKCNSKSPS